MTRYLIIFFTICSLFLWGNADISHYLITEEGEATPLLQDLLTCDGIKEKDLTTIVLRTQEKWVAVKQGNGGRERCDLTDEHINSLLAEKAHAIADQMGLFQSFSPEKKHYDYAVVLGAFLKGVKPRLEGVIDLWRTGITFDTLVFLGGERTLRTGVCEGDDPIYLDRVLTRDVPYVTEYDMLRWLWENYKVEGLARNVIFINAPRGDYPRPSTADTYRAWLSTNPQPGSVLAMSSVGLAPYQHLVGKNCLGTAFDLETVTPHCQTTNKPSVKIILDTIAKILFEYEKETHNSHR